MISRKELIAELTKAALDIRCQLLKLCLIQNIHIGGDLSITDVMTVLWQYKLKYDSNNVHDEFRDRFVLSKGHASAVMCLNQAAIGCFNVEDIINEYATDEGRFSMHACKMLNPYVEVSTGSLGHGMPIACGMAAALKLKGNITSRVYTVMGDGEQAEGSIWEAAMNAVHYQLGNLVAIIDHNKFGADGSLNDFTGIGNLADKYRAFGWKVFEIDGHDIGQILDTFDNLPEPYTYIPSVIICHTVKGKGVAFMENQCRWHTGKLSNQQFEEAIVSLKNNYLKEIN